MESLLLPVTLAAIVLAERLPRLRFERSRFRRRHFGTDVIYLATGAFGLGLVLREAGVRAVAGLGTLVPDLAALPLPAALLLATLLYDLAAYATHLLLHRVAPLWRLHKVHHSSPTLDWLAAFRAHILEHALRHLASTGALLALGLPLPAVAGAASLYAAWAAFNHANLRLDLRLLEPLLVTPRLHRLHHVPATSERNLGTIFSLWDRLRGSLVTDAGAAPLRLGVPGEVDSYPQSWPAQLAQPFRKQPPAVDRAAPRGPAPRGSVRALRWWRDR
jgi:sterol desaturase/sphingolipid hydroxylase (fatty acid hydroxylase superfamily)